MGLLVDADLGNYSDDYFGCDSSQNVMYFYNADNFDENGYELNPPALGIISIEQPLASFQKPAGIVNGTPSERKQQYWNQFNGLNEDGIDPDNSNNKKSFSNLLDNKVAPCMEENTGSASGLVQVKD